jgi:hypothetical protein
VYLAYNEAKQLNLQLHFAAAMGYEKQIEAGLESDLNHVLVCLSQERQSPEITESPCEIWRTETIHLDGKRHIPLTCAIYKAEEESVRLLLQRSAAIDFVQRNLKNLTFLAYAFCCSLTTSDSDPKQAKLQKIIGMLLSVKQLQVESNLAESVRQELLMHEKTIQGTACLKWLSTIKEMNPASDLTPFLFLIAECGSLQICPVPFDQATQTLEGDTLLHLACKRANLPNIQFLLSKTFDPWQLNHAQETSIDLLITYSFQSGRSVKPSLKALLSKSSSIQIWNTYDKHCKHLLNQIEKEIGKCLLTCLENTFSQNDSLTEDSPKKPPAKKPRH